MKSLQAWSIIIFVMFIDNNIFNVHIIGGHQLNNLTKHIDQFQTIIAKN